MPRIGKRITISRGIYRDGKDGGFEVRVTVGGVPYSARMPPDSTEKELKARRAQLEAQGHTASPRAERHTLRFDAQRYLAKVTHLASWDDREDHLNAWCALYGNVYRHRLTEQDVLDARDIWRAAGKSNKTINHYVGTLRNLYHRLDGKRAWTPCDEVADLPVAKTMIQRVSDALILAVDAELQRREQNPRKRFDGAKTRARFRVLVSTGKRPCEIMRAKPEDVDLEHRVWVPRDAKGGYCPGVYLNEDMLAAWRLFVEADAWGPYSTSAFADTIRQAGWPAHIRPYQARHTTWITARERGVPLHDVAVGAGHRDPRLTQRVYTGILNGPLQRMSETLDGRFGGFPVVPDCGSGKSVK